MKKLIQISIIMTCISLLIACTTLGGLSRSQVKVLQEAGFIYTDDGWTLDMPTSLLFATNEHELNSETQEKIANLMKKIKAIKINTIIVQGHTDNIGTLEHNQDLSLKRAQSVANIALNNGFSATNVKSIGYADSKPLASNDTEAGRSENRRVAVIIVP